MASVQVNTVLGPVPAEDLGMTLTHEHLVSDWTSRFTAPDDPVALALFESKVDPSMAWLLRDDPGCCRDNAIQDDPQETIEELRHFGDAGGRTVVECTNQGIGRDPAVLRHISEQSGLNVVMGSGWYQHPYHDPAEADLSVGQLVDSLLPEFADGVGDTGIKPGIIGEIGVSPRFTDAEKVRLRAACRVRAQVGVPLVVHMPGWQRRAFEVLDIVLDEEGVDPAAVVLCHMDPSGADPAYQRAVAERGVWLEFDMIGMPFYFDGEGQSPSPEETAVAVARLVEAGHAGRLLLSHDIAGKAVLTRNGGNGFGYVPRLFLPRLQRHGVPAEVTADLMTANPRRLFTAAAA